MVSQSATGGHQLQGLLGRQHAEVRQLFAATYDAPEQRRQPALRRLTRFLAIHEAAEQVALHGRGVRDLGEQANLSKDRLTEEDAAADVIGRLESLDPASASFNIQLGLLEEAVERHARAEEAEELPVLLDVLSESDTRLAVATLTAVAELVDEEGGDARVPQHLPFEGQHAAALRLFEERAAAVG